MKITFLDVGQGDAIHIKTPTGKHILIDAGRWSPANNSGEQVILPYFEALNVNLIDALILSHPHADHIGGVIPVLEKMDVSRIYQSDYEYDSQLYKNFIELAEKKKIQINHVYAGDLLEIDRSMRFYVIGPEKSRSLPSNPNNYSVALKVQYQQHSILLTGDAEARQENRMAEIYGEFIKSDLYKMCHHGSKTSSSPGFIEFVKPEIVVTSLAFQNRFRHPNREAITAVSKFSGQNYYTSLEGAVIIAADGKLLNKEEWR